MATATYSVTGMTCSHCVSSVTKEVEKISGVGQIDVDLSAGRLSVTSETTIDGAAVLEAVEEAGYEATRI